MTLLEALRTHGIFGHAFAGESWDTWRAVAAALDGLPLDARQWALWEQCTRRPEPPTVPATELWVVAGRRSGKSRFAAAVTVHAAVSLDPALLAPGETGVALLVATDQRQASVCLEYCRGLLEASPLLRKLIARQTSDAIELKNRCRIEVKSSNYRSVRGLTLVCCVVDEIAFLRSDESATPDVELIRAVKPGLSTTGGRLICISSPWSRRGVLFDRYRRHFGKAGKVVVWQAGSTVMNPGLDVELIAGEREADAEAARAEWDGLFRSDLEQLFSREALDAVVVPDRHELPPLPETSYRAFADPSGGSADSFTFALAHGEVRGEQHVAVLDVVREWRPPFSPDAVIAEIAELCRAYGVTRVEADRYAGLWVVEAFSKAGLHCEQSAAPKSELYGALLPLVNAHRVELLDLPRLHAQLLGLERRTSRSGRDSIDHGPAQHDDVANGAAGALVAAAAISECIVMGGTPRGPRWSDALQEYVTPFRRRAVATEL